jgi:hypothetical protein
MNPSFHKFGRILAAIISAIICAIFLFCVVAATINKSILGVLFAGLMALCFGWNAYNLFRNKAEKRFSVITYIIILLTTLFILIGLMFPAIT